MHRAFDSLKALTDPSVCIIDEEGREALIDESVDCIRNKTFDGWDWHLDMYDLLTKVVKEEDQYERIIRTMDSDTKLQDNYYLKQAMIYRRNLLARWHGEKAAVEFMMQNLQISDFREEAISRAIDIKD